MILLHADIQHRELCRHKPVPGGVCIYPYFVFRCGPGNCLTALTDPGLAAQDSGWLCYFMTCTALKLQWWVQEGSVSISEQLGLCLCHPGRIGKTQRLLFPGKHLRFILDEVLKRPGLGKTQSPHALEQAGSSARSLFSMASPPRVLWNFVGVVIYRAPVLA